MIHLAQTNDGRLILASDQAFPSDIAHVEYFRDLKLFMLSYEDEKHSDDLMPYELPDNVAKIVIHSPNITIIVRENDDELYGYVVSLVQIGL